jgi:hypothetical protein
MSDMEDLKLHAVGSHSDAPAEEPHLLMTPPSTSSGHYSPAKDSSYHQVAHAAGQPLGHVVLRRFAIFFASII